MAVYSNFSECLGFESGNMCWVSAQGQGDGVSWVESFPPIVGPHNRILLLGSMPGLASLRAGQYYAHPQNLFWPILGALLGFDPQAPYAVRVAHLQQAGVAVWDVLARCVRPGSLDAEIDLASAEPNDLIGLLRASPGIRRVCFNGAMAEKVFRRQVLPQCVLAGLDVPELLRLPSTSPANASIPLAQKQACWREALKGGVATGETGPALAASGPIQV